jgi:phage antirepressor YoqD-like protein
VWFVIARTSAEADLPNSICKALHLYFDDVFALLLEAGILYSKQQACNSTTPKDRIDVKTDEIDTLNSHFLNLSIEHTCKWTKDAPSTYETIHYIGRGKLVSKTPA